jgi:hypothetical protein
MLCGGSCNGICDFGRVLDRFIRISGKDRDDVCFYGLDRYRAEFKVSPWVSGHNGYYHGNFSCPLCPNNLTNTKASDWANIYNLRHKSFFSKVKIGRFQSEHLHLLKYCVKTSTPNYGMVVKSGMFSGWDGDLTPLSSYYLDSCVGAGHRSCWRFDCKFDTDMVMLDQVSMSSNLMNYEVITGTTRNILYSTNSKPTEVFENLQRNHALTSEFKLKYLEKAVVIANTYENNVELRLNFFMNEANRGTSLITTLFYMSTEKERFQKMACAVQRYMTAYEASVSRNFG